MKVTQEELEDLLGKMNEKLRAVAPVTDIITGFVEISENERYAIQTFSLKVTELKDLKKAILYFTEEIVSKINPQLPLYLRKEIQIRYNSPSYYDLYTMDFMEKPTKASWIIYCRLRQPGNEISGFRKGEAEYSKIFDRKLGAKK